MATHLEIMDSSGVDCVPAPWIPPPRVLKRFAEVLVMGPYRCYYATLSPRGTAYVYVMPVSIFYRTDDETMIYDAFSMVPCQ